MRPGLLRPASLFASNETGPAGGSAREIETISFLAARTGLTINTDFGVGDEPQLVAALPSAGSPILICREHDHIPTIADALGSVSPAVPQTWPDDRFDVVWVFVRTQSRGTTPSYRFSQVPELLMPGDANAPIS
ncbi:MAG TPA: hypothetical protein VHX88_17890 [Solirubrobacteraceae bacterium]|nr:hypothetical protein [Solirubrobacteraceae bacterium]